MPKYKVGERVVVGAVETIVVRGSCESCFFNINKGIYCRLGAERCIDEIGLGNYFKVLKEGL